LSGASAHTRPERLRIGPARLASGGLARIARRRWRSHIAPAAARFMTHNRGMWKCSIAVLAAVAALCVSLNAQSPGPSTYYPDRDWRVATPESQGLDSNLLAEAVAQVRAKQLGVHSLLVIRHGYAVADVDFYPYSSAAPHDIASITKTITSTLTGVAVGRGLVKLDQPLLAFFPKEQPAGIDERKRAITVRDLLYMESGLDCGFLPGEQELEQMKRSPNWVQFALSLPMRNAPGTRPSYCSPGYHLLGSVIGAAAGTSELEFGRKHLFDPLGMRDVVWGDDPQGRSHGWGDSHFYPRDIAKLGYLYLHQGQWKGQQIVARDWVAMSTTPAAAARTEPGGLGVEWGASNGANGRQFGGTGRGGQTLIVWPDLDMIVVSTAGGNAGQLAQLIRQAVTADAPLPANPAAQARLKRETAAAASAPAAAPRSPLPATAAAISGRVYDFPVNPSRIDSLSLTFAADGTARVDLSYYGEPLRIPLALDGVYHPGPYGPFGLPAAAMGKWTSDDQFLLDVNFIANINHYTLAMRFTPEQTVEVMASEASGLIRNGRLVSTAAARQVHGIALTAIRPPEATR
jgi:CubicO group peptidase (beta-lactamase class C family)